jgi:hypothetical protein
MAQYHDMLLDGGSYRNYPVPAPEMTCVEKKPHAVNIRYASFLYLPAGLS